MNEKVEMWVSRYALTDGVKNEKGNATSSGRFYPTPYYAGLKIGIDAHPTEAEAIAAAEAMRVKKIASLQKQIARLEKLTF